MIENNNLSKIRSMYAIKANDLITKSRFSFSLEQQKVLLYMISKITPLSFSSDWFEIEVSDYCEICGLTRKGQYYKNIRESLGKIAKQQVWYETEKGLKDWFIWFSRLQTNENSGKIRYKFSEQVWPYLNDLKEKFTKIELIQTLTFSSKYTIRLYEYLKVFAFHAYIEGGYTEYTHEVELDELKRILSCENYKRFPDFRRYVLSIAENEINDKTTDMRIELHYKGAGRRIDKVAFEYLPIGQQDEDTASSQRKRILNREEHRNKKRAE